MFIDGGVWKADKRLSRPETRCGSLERCLKALSKAVKRTTCTKKLIKLRLRLSLKFRNGECF